jgi:hypothetical protein
VARTDAGVWVIALAAWQAGRPDLIRSARLVLAYVWVAGVSCRCLTSIVWSGADTDAVRTSVIVIEL